MAEIRAFFRREDGAQLPPAEADVVAKEMAATDIFSGVRTGDYGAFVESGMIRILGRETDEAYLNEVLKVAVNPDCVKQVADEFKLVYTPFHGAGYRLVPEILRAYESLAAENDVIVIEGAGSPAEINLKADDIVNMGLAKLVDAPVLLVGDIDRGGVFAQLFGTVELLEPDERARIKGLIINKFRGDVGILRPGLAMLEEKTHLPVFGVVPYLKVDIEDEDSLSDRLQVKNAVKPLDAAIVRLPHISNFTDFMPLEQHPLLGVRYVQTTRELGTPDCVILPGTKNTVDDLLWLRQCGLEAAISKLAQRGTPVLGVCGGYQMLGQTLADPEGTESGRPQTLRGLGLLQRIGLFGLGLLLGAFRLLRRFRLLGGLRSGRLLLVLFGFFVFLCQNLFLLLCLVHLRLRGRGQLRLAEHPAKPFGKVA